MKKKLVLCLLLCWGWTCTATALWAQDTGWMQKGVRIWYLGLVDSGGVTSSTAEEAYLLEAVEGVNVRVKHHSALTHWTSSLPVETRTCPLVGKGPCWIHPAVLQTLKGGIQDSWMDQEIVGVVRSSYTYATFPYHLLPATALFDLNPQRQFVKLVLMSPYFSTGEAYFDAETGLLLLYYTSSGVTQRFNILSEINYDFARHAAFPEDDGPHTGFRSITCEQSMGYFSPPIWVGGGSVVIQSLVETRYRDIVEMRVSTSIIPPSGSMTQKDENYCFFGSVPIVRRMNATQAGNLPPDQWNPWGQDLWWWIPPAALEQPTIIVFNEPMERTATQPYTFTAIENPLLPVRSFYFYNLSFGNDGYMTVFSARERQTGLDVNPGDFNFTNCTTVDGPSYYRNVMGRATPAVNRPPSILPTLGPLLLY
jgi:hypothetical protein